MKKLILYCSFITISSRPVNLQPARVNAVDISGTYECIEKTGDSYVGSFHHKFADDDCIEGKTFKKKEHGVSLDNENTFTITQTGKDIQVVITQNVTSKFSSSHNTFVYKGEIGEKVIKLEKVDISWESNGRKFTSTDDYKMNEISILEDNKISWQVSVTSKPNIQGSGTATFNTTTVLKKKVNVE